MVHNVGAVSWEKLASAAKDSIESNVIPKILSGNGEKYSVGKKDNEFNFNPNCLPNESILGGKVYC